MRRRRVGIAIVADRVDVALVVRDVVRWFATARVDDTEALAGALTRLLSTVPASRFARTHAYVALGPRHAQVKRLEGLPPLANGQLVTQLVRENAGAFFLRRSARLLVPAVARQRDGTTWGAAFDADIVDAIAAAVRGAGIRLVVVAPGPRGPCPQEPPARISNLGPGGLTCLDAYNATRTSRHAALAWQPPKTRSTLMRRAQRIATVFVIAVAVSAAVLAPALRDALYVRRHTTEVSQREVMRLDIDRATIELAQVTRLLNRIESFRAERGRVTRLLGAIAQAIPDSTAIGSVRIDSVEGSFTAIAPSPRVTDILPLLASVDGVSSARIVGSVTRETPSGIRVDRAVFRFRRPAAVPALATAPK